MSIVVPAGYRFIVNTVLLKPGELAKSILVDVSEPSILDVVVEQVAHRAANMIERDVPRGATQILTLNLIDNDRRGGCSWQALEVRTAKTRAQLAAAVYATVGQMVDHGLRTHLTSTLRAGSAVN